MENIVLSEKNQLAIYTAAAEIANGKTTFTQDEMLDFSINVARKLKFMVHIDTVRRYLEAEYTTIIPVPEFPKDRVENWGLKDMFNELGEYWKDDKSDFIFTVLFLIGIFFVLWAGLWFIAIIEGRV